MARILISDDADGYRLGWRYALKRHHEVYTASGGSDTLMALGQRQFDLLITDVQNPNMDGRDLTAYVALRFPELPIMVITEYFPSHTFPSEESSGDLASQLTEAGVAGFMVKSACRDIEQRSQAIQYCVDHKKSVPMRIWY